MTLMGALTRLQGLGYRRIGLFLARFKDERITHEWSAAFTAFQRSVGTVGEVPLLMFDKAEAGGFLRWHHRHEPDLVIGHVDETVVWLQRTGMRVPEQTAFSI